MIGWEDRKYRTEKERKTLHIKLLKMWWITTSDLDDEQEHWASFWIPRSCNACKTCHLEDGESLLCVLLLRRTVRLDRTSETQQCDDDQIHPREFGRLVCIRPSGGLTCILVHQMFGLSDDWVELPACVPMLKADPAIEMASSSGLTLAGTSGRLGDGGVSSSSSKASSMRVNSNSSVGAKLRMGDGHVGVGSGGTSDGGCLSGERGRLSTISTSGVGEITTWRLWGRGPGRVGILLWLVRSGVVNLLIYLLILSAMSLATCSAHPVTSSSWESIQYL